MTFAIDIFKVPARKILSFIPTSVLGQIEDWVQKEIGKGSGAWSTKREAAVIAGFVESLGIKTVVAIDAGANLGNWTGELLEIISTAKVVAFEPSQSAFELLQRRFSHDSRVLVQKIALGKENKLSTLYADQGGSGLGSLTKRRVEHFNIEFNHQEKVEIQALDSWISQNQIDEYPNILKMDVEGHEYDVLLGATEILKSIKIIQFEFGGSNIDTRTFFQDFWYFFEKLGFNIYRLTPRKPILIQHYSERDETFRSTNYVAVRTDEK